MRKEKEICYICGKEGADSRDHIPPKSLFYRNLPYDLLTLPAHQRCQERFSLDEEYFVYVMCTGSWKNNAAWAKYWNEISPKLKDTNKKKFRQSLINSLSKAALKSQSGLALGQVDIMNVDMGRINNIIAKIIYALHFHHSGTTLPDEAVVSIISNLQPQNLGKSFIEDFKGNDHTTSFHQKGNYSEFKYSFKQIPDSNATVWYLIFYCFFEFHCHIRVPGQVSNR